MEKFYILTKFVNQKNQLTVTNRTITEFEIEDSILATTDGGVSIETRDGNYTTEALNSLEGASNPMYDMLFYYNGTLNLEETLKNKFNITTILEKGESTNNKDPKIILGNFQRIKSDGWFISATKHSLNDALLSAKPIIKALGLTNVKIVSEAPVGIKIGLNL